MTRAFHESYTIWLQSSSSSRDAQKAAELLRLVLEEVNVSTIASMTGNVMKTPKPSAVSNDTVVPCTGRRKPI